MTNVKHFLIALLFAAPFTGTGQHKVHNTIPENQLKLAARDIMTSAATCALITLDPEGRPRARMMDPFPPEDDFTVWFGTNPDSRKVRQIKNDPEVSLYYTAGDNSGYVLVVGKAELVDDPMEKEKRWKEAWAAFYPDWPEDYLLIRVTPDWLEVVSYTHGILGDTLTWEPPSVSFDPK